MSAPGTATVSIAHYNAAGISEVRSWAINAPTAEWLARQLGEPHVHQLLTPEQLRAVVVVAETYGGITLDPEEGK